MMMNRRYLAPLALAAAASLGTSAVAAPPSPRVPPGMEVHDLSTLADGETREFGTAEHRVTASRAGEVVTVTMPTASGEGEGPKSFTCASGDRCLVMVGSEGKANKMIVVKTREDDEGSAEERHVNVVVVGKDGDPVVIEGEGSGFHVESETGEDGADVHVVQIGRGEHGDQVLVRCPEGDTTMFLDKDDDAEYRCPKHGAALVKAERRKVTRVFEKKILRARDDAGGDAKPGED